MKTTISKDIKHSLLIEEDELKTLHKFISERYDEIKATAKCADGSMLESKNIEEIISFENPNYRNIEAISITSYTQPNEKFSLDISERLGSTAELQIESLSDETALYIINEIQHRLAEMKPWYDLIARLKWALIILIPWLAWSLVFTFQQFIGIRPPSNSNFSTFETFNFAVLFAVVFFIIVLPLEWLQKKLFPKVFYLIGKQVKTMDSIEKWRNFIFGGIILTLVMAVVGTALSNWILK